jgi:hypothetical protein
MLGRTDYQPVDEAGQGWLIDRLRYGARDVDRWLGPGFGDCAVVGFQVCRPGGQGQEENCE